MYNADRRSQEFIDGVQIFLQKPLEKEGRRGTAAPEVGGSGA